MSVRIRKYPHFDGGLSAADAEALVTNPKAVARHTFFPFIESAQPWTKFAPKAVCGESKERPIRYAARRDACIYSCYREQLVGRYEARLISAGIADSIIAYRRIPKACGPGNKSNIDFADDAFEVITARGDCHVYALDIKGFFESIDHGRLKAVWADLLGENALPADHFAVFKNVTKYAWVDKEKLYRTLGFIGEKQNDQGANVTGYIVDKVPLQVCDSSTFRSKVVPHIQVNPNKYGIPQGSPISDVLANMYLIDFDIAIAQLMTSCGGVYYRYSDDILLIIPGECEDVENRLATVQAILSACGDNLALSQKKSTVHRFSRIAPGCCQLQCSLVHGKQGKNGLEYLGFRFDGQRVYVRDSTLAGLNRKITVAARRLARQHVLKNPSMTQSQLIDSFKFSLLLTKFGRVKEFENNEKGYLGWTFWTYARRSSAVFGPKGRPILKQLSCYRKYARNKVISAISKYHGKL